MKFDVKNFSENNIQISVFDIQIITGELKRFIDENIHQICLGENGYLATVKLDLKARIEGWGDQNKIIGIAQQFEILETITNSDNIIYFSKILGESNQNATITVSHITNRIPQKQIIIKKSGSISVIE